MTLYKDKRCNSSEYTVCTLSTQLAHTLLPHTMHVPKTNWTQTQPPSAPPSLAVAAVTPETAH